MELSVNMQKTLVTAVVSLANAVVVQEDNPCPAELGYTLPLQTV